MEPATSARTGGDRLALTLLGRFELLRDGRPLALPAGGERLVALLGVLGPCTREQAAATLWPEAGPQHAHGRLRTTLWRVSRRWPGLVAATGRQLCLDPAVDLDTRRFLTRALRLVEDATPVPPGELGLDALAAGELLPGWYDEWVVFERERLRHLRLHALEQLSARLVAAGRYALALEAALEAMRSEPLRESAHRAVLAVHLAEGNVVEARRHYDELRRLLQEELHVLPSRSVELLMAGRIPRQRPSPAVAGPGDGPGRPLR